MRKAWWALRALTFVAATPIVTNQTLESTDVGSLEKRTIKPINHEPSTTSRSLLIEPPLPSNHRPLEVIRPVIGPLTALPGGLGNGGRDYIVMEDANDGYSEDMGYEYDYEDAEGAYYVDDDFVSEQDTYSVSSADVAEYEQGSDSYSAEYDHAYDVQYAEYEEHEGEYAAEFEGEYSGDNEVAVDDLEARPIKQIYACEGVDCEEGAEELDSFAMDEKDMEENMELTPFKPLPFPRPCKGNCPLKHNLLPKYEPDDGGTLKCPEHNERQFRTKQGGALFEIVCYADYGGRNMKVETETSLDSCINTCNSVQQCKAVVFVPGEIDGACYLKFNEGKSHMNPFVMSARLIASNCVGGVNCERHNKVWEMEQEEARKERHRIQLEETREKIENLRKEREDLERERQQERIERQHDRNVRGAKAKADAAERERYKEYVKNEEAYRMKKHHEMREKERDRLRTDRRYKWKLAVEERERERLRHQVEAEREALEREMDKVQHQEWEDDESWWDEGRFKSHPSYEVTPQDVTKEYGDYCAEGPEELCAEEFVVNEDGYPTDDEWHWYPDQSWRGYWEAEGIEREQYEGYITEEDMGGPQNPTEEWKPYEVSGALRPPGYRHGLERELDNPCCYDPSYATHDDRPECNRPCTFEELAVSRHVDPDSLNNADEVLAIVEPEDSA